MHTIFGESETIARVYGLGSPGGLGKDKLGANSTPQMFFPTENCEGLSE